MTHDEKVISQEFEKVRTIVAALVFSQIILQNDSDLKADEKAQDAVFYADRLLRELEDHPYLLGPTSRPGRPRF